MYYIYLAIFAYVAVLYLTLRDIRIYKRTKLDSYRKGAMKGILASSIVLLGILFTTFNPEMGLLIVFIGMYANKKGVRERVFNNADAMDRFLGKTDI
ncbi:hypothetical protein MettiDRAFT_1858 [Methanolobus tindarius DSM 2278]|jgi:hypothetical protein|uniref:YtpI-like protein n=1 Tax=Methanolobus tindarius DSM 2278 TaxID=1090322 RepID=W9DPS7_METTI|nr:hypothetical protein [Methanolobus tindarius]ETA68389.1 hypothetical protein MettiDRAFT_1858 [Methanolobus tindarius DSM 2278]